MRITKILDRLKLEMGEVKSELDYENPFQLIVAVALSAQCTDKRVNQVTPSLFKAFPTSESMANAGFDEIFSYIKSVSYPNNKTKHLIGMAQMLVNEFNSIVPSDIEQLTKLPGVGRKTANVIAAIIYGKPVIAVDTHVFRVAKRLELSEGTTVEAVEKDLTNQIPAEERPDAHHYLLLHGRYVCTARKPHCDKCCLNDLCDYSEKCL